MPPLQDNLSEWPRIIALCDMNAFFASVEQRDHPQWRARPVGVTNGAQGTCLITCSYEARALGIKTGMRLREARQLCPGLIQAPSRPLVYTETATKIMRSLESLTPDIEIFSIDECFLEFTHCPMYRAWSPEALMQRIKACVFEASGLLCSVGLSGDKTTAKWAAKLNKPNGMAAVAPAYAETALIDVPVTDLCGVGSGIGRFLAERGVERCGEMKHIPVSVLGRRFGNPGRRIWLMAQGKDPEPLQAQPVPAKSCGHGKVIPPDTQDRDTLEIYLRHMAEKVGRRLRKNGWLASRYRVTLLSNLGWLGERHTLVASIDDGRQIYDLAKQTLASQWHGEGIHQLHILAEDPAPPTPQADLFLDPAPNQKRQQLNQLIDAINSRYGEFTIAAAPLLNRSEMPNVIAPSWRPDGHRESISY